MDSTSIDDLESSSEGEAGNHEREERLAVEVLSLVPGVQYA